MTQIVFNPAYFDAEFFSTIGEVGEAVDLAPDNASAFVRTLAGLSNSLEEVDPSVIETLWDAWRCPSALLPWLAWAMSIDVWDDGWGETTKRQAIADSPAYHRRKGTVMAVRAALALAERPYELTEWFDHVPVGRRGTANVFVETTLDDISRVLHTIKPLVLSSKPKSRAVFFGAGELVPGDIVVGGGMLVERLITVEPYSYSGENADGSAVVAAGLLVERLITIEASS